MSQLGQLSGPLYPVLEVKVVYTARIDKDRRAVGL